MTTTNEVIESIRSHGQATYPEEGCGLLLGEVSPEQNRVVAAWPVVNREAEGRERRYSLAPADYLAADREARRQGLDVVGFYHSHPDHPARPSETDLAEATFPGYSYVIVSVHAGTAKEVTAWRLAADRSCFAPETITITPTPVPEPLLSPPKNAPS